MLTISQACLDILTTANARSKAECARAHCAALDGNGADFGNATPPDRPARPATPCLVPPRDMPKRTKAGLKGRQALIHALAHIELNAIDLAADIIIRFGRDLPRAFTLDWLSVVDDEARHFLMLADRLEEMGLHYGALDAHDGLWQSAEKTGHDLLSRLAVVPLVHEARGLDVTPATVERLRAHGDEASARCLDIIYTDEINHVAIGRRWFEELCHTKGLDPASHFRLVVAQARAGAPKPPFNDQARQKAGLMPDFYR